jgi:hypothetical protein
MHSHHEEAPNMPHASKALTSFAFPVWVRLLAVLVAICVCACCGVGASAALAAGPEQPVTEAASAVTANAAVLHGELNPGAVGSGSWYFDYAPGASCLGGSQVYSYEEVDGQGVKVATEVSGLEPDTEYSFCIVAVNGLGEESQGTPKSLHTPVSQPVVDSEGASVGSLNADLEAQVDPEKQATTCLRFEYAEASVYQGTGHYTNSVPCANMSLGSEFGDQGASAEAMGLEPSTEYDFRVVVENPSSPSGGTDGPGQTFTTLALVEGQSFSAVGPQGVTLSANVNVYGVPVTYRFQYGPSIAYGSSTSGETLTGDTQADVATELTGLISETEYHARIVVESQNGAVEYGPDMSFTTLPPTIQGLPDGRVYEMVTPPENEDAQVYTPFAFSRSVAFYLSSPEYGIPTKHPFQASANGNSVAYVADPTSPGDGERGDAKGDEYIAARASAGGWTQTNLQPPGYKRAVYQAFSNDLSTAIFTVPASTYQQALVPGAPSGENAFPLYARSTGQGSYQLLSGEALGTAGTEEGQISYAGASANFSQVLFEANSALTSNSVSGSGEENNLYVSSSGNISAVNLLPGATTSEPNAVFGAPNIESEIGRFHPDFSNVISSSGARIFWTDLNTERIYVRENGTQTTAVSEGAARFWTATPEGEYVFYTEAGALLRYDVQTGTRETLAPGGAEVQGVLGISEEGSFVYFAANGELAEGAQAGQPNLYMLHNGGAGWEGVRFIATLGPGDGTHVEPFVSSTRKLGAVGDWEPGLGYRTAEVSSSGEGLVFMSTMSIPTADDPAGYPNAGLDEVYTYQANEGGRLFCVSCSTSGEQLQSNYETEEGHAAAFLPISLQNTYQPRWISQSGGRIFFDSAVPLVANDTNGQQDVYEWERSGEGSCTRAQGCVYLISDGTSAGASYFLDASADGDDAFIITRAKLAPQDQNEVYDLYDARVGGVRAVAPPACTGTGCQGVPSAPPTFATPASVTFEGVGNFLPTTKGVVKTKTKALTRAQKLARALRACAEHPRRRRPACRAAAKRRYGPVSKQAKRLAKGRNR